jgi:hypothetical protein
VRLLLDAGADPAIADQMNRTALDYAKGSGDNTSIALISFALNKAALTHAATVTQEPLAIGRPLRLRR